MAKKFCIEKFLEENYEQLLILAVMIVKDKNTAQDVLHTVAVNLISRKSELTGLENPTAFVAVCLRRAALNYLRKHFRSIPVDPASLHVIDDGQYSGAALDYIEWIIWVEDVLSDYDAEMRSAFLAHYVDGIELNALAAPLRVSSDTLSKRLRRMCHKIAERSPELQKQITLLLLF